MGSYIETDGNNKVQRLEDFHAFFGQVFLSFSFSPREAMINFTLQALKFSGFIPPVLLGFRAGPRMSEGTLVTSTEEKKTAKALLRHPQQ